MSKDIRHTLEEIAVDMVLLSMEFQGDRTARADAWAQVHTLTDAELVDYITA